jgi:all-trans-retinol 13,14-reductase
MTATTVIVGSGAGGLFAALTAAKRGRRVVVIEAAKAVGGLLNPFRRGAHVFDAGLHYIGGCGPRGLFAQLLERLELDVCFREIDPEGFDRIVVPGFEIRVPRGRDAYRERLANAFPSERAGIDGFFSALGSLSEALPRSFDALHDLTDSGDRATAPPASVAQLARETYQSFLARHVTAPALRAVLAAQSGNYALPPSRASAFVALATLDHYLDGAFYPVGGSGALRDALVGAIVERGGEVATQQMATRIHVRGGRARAVECANGRLFEADAIVSNADAATTLLDLVDPSSLSPRARDRVERLVPSLGAASLFLGARGGGELLERAGVTAANEWHFDAVDPEDGYVEALAGRTGIRSAFFSSPSIKDPSSAARGDATLTVIAPQPWAPWAAWADRRAMRRGAEYESAKAALRDALLARVERRVPGFVSRADVVDLGTPLSTTSFVGARCGGSYGPAHMPGQSGPLRGTVKTPIPGLYLAGASVFGAGVVWSALSGWVAGQLV